MDGENQEAIYCEDDGEYRIYCSVHDNSVLKDIIKII